MANLPSIPVVLALVFAGAVAMPRTAIAAEPVQITLKDHHFVPAEISVPANERFRIEVSNEDPTPAEFESADLRAEKIVVPGGKASVMAGPLKPGRYAFFDDYHPDTAQGAIIAAEQAGK